MPNHVISLYRILSWCIVCLEPICYCIDWPASMLINRAYLVSCRIKLIGTPRTSRNQRPALEWSRSPRLHVRYMKDQRPIFCVNRYMQCHKSKKKASKRNQAMKWSLNFFSELWMTWDAKYVYRQCIYHQQHLIVLLSLIKANHYSIKVLWLEHEHKAQVDIKH
jgi:hypothetical protein